MMALTATVTEFVTLSTEMPPNSKDTSTILLLILSITVIKRECLPLRYSLSRQGIPAPSMLASSAMFTKVVMFADETQYID